MKTLTIKQPWATLIALGHKKIENRSWTTNYRGIVAIHAAKCVDAAAWAPARRIMQDNEIPLDNVIQSVAYGGIVAVATLTAIYHADSNPPLDVLYDDWFCGEGYAWVLDDIRPVDFFPCPGQLGLWESSYSLDPLPEQDVCPGAIALQQDIFGGATPIFPKKRKPTQLGLLV